MDVVALEKLASSGWGLSMLVVPLPSGGVLVHSPTWLGDETFARVEAIGEPEILFAPNHFHHMSLARFRARWPNAKPVASDVATPRLRARGHEGLASLASVASSLPEGAHWLACEGTKAGEAFLSLPGERGATWLVSDAFFNVERPTTGAMGFTLRALKTTPGLSIGQTYLWLALADRVRYKKWILAELSRERPTKMLFSHGVTIEADDLADRLAALVERRL
jgi:hypothetical protein